MRKKTNSHLRTRNGRRTFAVCLAIWVTVLALALSTLASCKNPGDSGEPGDPGNSAKPEELLKFDSNAEPLFFAGIDENWIYYESHKDSTSTFWRANKDGTGMMSALGTRSYLKDDYYDLTPANGRLYYLQDSHQGICSSPIDFSETTVLTENANSFYSILDVVDEWIYFIREDPSVLPSGKHWFVEILCRMKLDGSDMHEIAALDGVTDFSNRFAVVGSRLYRYLYVDEYGFAIAMRTIQGGEETTISRGYNFLGSIQYSNGSLFYSATSPDTHSFNNLIFSLDTEAPYAEKTLLTGADEEDFDVAFAENGWVYYVKRKGYAKASSEMWRIRTDGTGAECLVNDVQYAFYLAIDGGYIYYETISEAHFVDPPYSIYRIYRMKTP